MTREIALFRQLARDFMRPVPLAVTVGATVQSVVLAMTNKAASCALMLDHEGRVVGILTEQDVTRRIAFQRSPDEAVAKAMTTPVETIPDQDYLYRAIASMRRRRVRHMPVVDQARRPVGLIDLHDALAETAVGFMDRIDRLSAEGTIEGLRAVKSAQVGLAQELFEDGVPASEIQQLLTDINNDIHRRIVQAALVAMAAEGWGAPPVDFEVLVMGSGGRGESFLVPDQDNGFILENYPDEEHGRVDRFFVELAERMTTDLNAVGFPFCQGFVMATNPLWRKSIGQWRTQTTAWSRKRNFLAARLVSLFFDFRSAYGDRVLARQLREHVTRVMGGSQGFLRELYRDEADRGTALGWFNRLITERDDQHRGQINLKLTGIMPLVEPVRLLALRHGVPETRTVERISALHDCSVLDADEKEYLTSAFEHLTMLMLRQQVNDFRDGKTVNTFIHPEHLSRRERDLLVDSFRVIEGLRSKIRADFTGDVF